MVVVTVRMLRVLGLKVVVLRGMMPEMVMLLLMLLMTEMQLLLVLLVPEMMVVTVTQSLLSGTHASNGSGRLGSVGVIHLR